jgi:hypothetical protein
VDEDENEDENEDEDETSERLPPFELPTEKPPDLDVCQSLNRMPRLACRHE